MSSQAVAFNFGQGENSKTDPWQLPVGQFLSLTNSLFQKGGLLGKRPGYATVATAPARSAYLTTLNNNLLSVGNTINAECVPLNQFIAKGNLQPCSLSVAPAIRNNLNQIQTDSAVANGLICMVYTQQNTTTSAAVSTYLYAIQDATTQQNIITPSAIPVLSSGTISGSSRVVVVGEYFVILSPVTVSGTVYLQYFSIPLNNPALPSAAQNTFAEAYVPLGSNPGWDAVVANGVLLVGYNTTAGGQGVHITSLTAAQIAANQASGVVRTFTNAAYKAGIMSLCADTTVVPAIIYVSFWNPTTTDGYTCAVYSTFGALTIQFSPQKIISTVATVNLASCAQNSSCLVFSETTNAYSYDSTLPSNFITGVSVSSAGVVGTPGNSIRSVGLASKAFIVSGVAYFLSAFQSTYQPSYFVINGSTSTAASPVIVAKLAYQNGGGYLTLGLPSVTLENTTASFSYLYKQNVEALNTLNNTQQTTAGGIYSQLGINVADITFGTDAISSAEIAQDLHLSGGYLSIFDGYYPVEHNFFLFPDNLQCAFTATSAVTPTGTFSLGGTTVVVSSATGILAGMSITDTSNATYIPAGTIVLYVSGTTVTISKPTIHAAAGDSLSIQANMAAKPDGTTNTNAYFYQGVCEWTDSKGNAYKSQPSIPVGMTTSGSGTAGYATINLPTLRLTQKVATPVKLVLYRWSAHTQVYNQVTSITAPLLNSTTVDSVTFVDTLADASVIGNNLIYTTGGVQPDSNGPASNVINLFDTRLFMINAEDDNVLTLSKTVVEGTPVEIPLAFTIYVAPNIGTTGSTGGMKCLFPMDDKLIIFKKNSIFYINGTGPDNLGSTSPGSPLGNYSQPTFITSVTGCDNPKSIVLTPDGLMFQSDNGIWIIDRFSLKASYLGAPVEAYNDFVVTSATVIPNTTFVVFTLNTNVILMYDYYYSQWGHWKVPNPIISSCISNGLHTVLTDQGQIQQQTPGTYMDGTDPVLMQFTSSWLNLASLQGYQRFREMYFLGQFLSPHQLQVQIAYNYNPSLRQASLITPQNFSTSVPSPFGSPTPVGSVPQLEQWRIHAKEQLCQSFQISVQEVFDPSYGTLPGAGFTMSGVSCDIQIKKAMRPIKGANAVG